MTQIATIAKMQRKRCAVMIFDDFLIRAAIAAVGVAIAAAPLGCFVVWRRMAYVGDATAYAAILGVALALALSVLVIWGILLIAIGMAFTVSALGERGATTDSLLGVLAYSALAAGLVAASLLSPGKLDLMAYLFGDILVVSKADLALILGGACAVSFLLIRRWRALVTTIVSLDLAYAAGYSPRKAQLVLTLALALVVAIAIKVVGAMLIIPVAAVRPWARGPEAMVLLATSAAVVAALGGLQASLWFETPTGPSIVYTAALMFALPFALRSIFGRG